MNIGFLDVLRELKSALDEGLISSQDYERTKKSQLTSLTFLRDAGYIYLQSLGIPTLPR